MAQKPIAMEQLKLQSKITILKQMNITANILCIKFLTVDGGRKNKDKIGETKSLEDAVTLAKVSVDGSIRNIGIN